jgi:pimeloyl-ACP methyl ester carboxylesterase
MHLIRGARSDLLTAEIAERMQTSGPRPGLTLFDDCGHAPSLVSPAAIAGVAEVLDALIAGGA